MFRRIPQSEPIEETKDIPRVDTQVVYRLPYGVYQELEQKLGSPTVNDNTGEIRAGFQLGIQHVLQVLRRDYVIGT